MKSITVFFLIVFLFGFKVVTYSQTYYNPRENINITLTIKEPFKPVNYAEIGANINNVINTEIQKREYLKKYYDDIFYQSTSSVFSNTVLSNDNFINSNLTTLQSKTIDELNLLNRLLKSGLLKPNEYESKLRSTYYNYMGANQILLNILNYKVNKLNSLTEETSKYEFSKIFNETIGNITGYKIDFKGVIFYNGGISNDINTLYNYISSSCDVLFDKKNTILVGTAKIIEKQVKDRVEDKKNIEISRIEPRIYYPSEIVGTSMKIGRLEIAENYFPIPMTWEDAKKACSAFGNGWRLPSKEELNFLSQHKDIFCTSYFSYYWSSTEYSPSFAWMQVCNSGEQFYHAKDEPIGVRAVRSF